MTKHSPQITIKRAYEDPDPSDGYRVLVDRLWPRGMSKERIAIDEWCKDVAPSVPLRRWFGHDPERFDEFGDRYEHELQESDAPQQLLDRVPGDCSKLTLVYAAHDERINHAVLLRAHLAALLAPAHSGRV